MTYNEFLESNNKQNNILFEIDLGVQLTSDGWIKDEGTTWKITYSWDEESITFGYGFGAWGYGAYGSGGATTLLTPERPSAIKIPSIIVDGSPIVDTPDLATCRSTPSSFYFDSNTQILYINNNNFSYSPDYTYNTITLGITKGFSRISTYYNNIYYDGRIQNAPNITTQRDSLFYGKISFEGASIDLINTDGFFDDFGDQDIYGAEVRIYYGSDEIDSGDKFQILYTGTIEDYQLTPDLITINFIDSRKLLSTKVPDNILDGSTYPQLNNSNNGQVVPIAYGVINKAPAYCLNEEESGAATYSFKFVDTTHHTIQSIDAVYVNNKSVSLTSLSTTDGTFSLSNADYEPGDDVTVDFHGFIDSESNLIDNPLDILKDVLTTYTTVQYNSAYFNTSDWEAAKSSLTESIAYWVGNRTEIVQIIEKISQSILGIFYIQGDGLFSFYLRDTGKASIDKIYIDNFIQPANIVFKSDEYINSARVRYNIYWAENKGSFYTDDSLKSSLFEKYRKNSEKEFDTVLSSSTDAIAFAEDAMNSFGGVFPTYTITTKTNFIQLNITDNVDLEIKRYDDGTSAIAKCEVISKDLSLSDYSITFELRLIESLSSENLASLIRYRSDISYSPGDVVSSSSGGLWRAIVPTEGNPPQPGSDFWEEYIYTANDNSVGPMQYNGFTRLDGALYGGASDPTSTTRLNYDGYFYATKVYNAVYNDLAEYIKCDGQKIIHRIYSASNKGLTLSREKSDSKAIGVASDSAGFILKDELKESGVLIGLAGTLWVDTIGKIKIGQELVSSGKEGKAMKATLFDTLFNREAIIGKVLDIKGNKAFILIK